MPETDAGLRPDLSRPRRVHIVGAGGSGMSAIAIVLLGMGHRVTGSDAATSPVLSRLADLGAEVHVGHDPAWVGQADVVVRSTAVPDGDPEVVAARQAGLRVWRRSELLAAICAERRVAAVSGTHGKTTTSSLLYLILRHAGWHPSMIVGGDIAGVGPGAVWDTEGEWMVVEADESDGTFLELGAEAVIVTSVEPDHLEHYGGEAALSEAFSRFLSGASGPAVVCADDAGAQRALAGARAANAGLRSVTYGEAPAADVRVTGIELSRRESGFLLESAGGPVARVSLPAPGRHNVANAAAAVTLAHLLGIPWEAAAAGVLDYRGVGRRFEWRGERGGVTFIDDYGHLPSEVAAALAAARVGGWARVVAIFQPHRFSRTATLWADFADAFEAADVLILTDVYPAGEPPRPGVSGRLIFDAVRAGHPDADVRYLATLDEIVDALPAILRDGDVCLTLGAGDITKLPDRLLA